MFLVVGPTHNLAGGYLKYLRQEVLLHNPNFQWPLYWPPAQPAGPEQKPYLYRHDHPLVFPPLFCQDQRVRTVDFRALYQAQRGAQCVLNVSMAHELRLLGLEAAPHRGNSIRVVGVGVSKDTPRVADIREHLQKEGVRETPAARAVAAIATRAEKALATLGEVARNVALEPTMERLRVVMKEVHKILDRAQCEKDLKVITHTLGSIQPRVSFNDIVVEFSRRMEGRVAPGPFLEVVNQLKDRPQDFGLRAVDKVKGVTVFAGERQVGREKDLLSALDRLDRRKTGGLSEDKVHRFLPRDRGAGWVVAPDGTTLAREERRAAEVRSLLRPGALTLAGDRDVKDAVTTLRAAKRDVIILADTPDRAKALAAETMAKVRTFLELAEATRKRTVRECLMKGFRADGPPIKKVAAAVAHHLFGHERLRKGTTIVLSARDYLDKVPEILAAAEAVRRCKGKLILDGPMAKELGERLQEHRREMARSRGRAVRPAPEKGTREKPRQREGETRAEFAKRQQAEGEQAERERRDCVRALREKYFGRGGGPSR